MQTADWCETDGDFSICGTRMREASRRHYGHRWCFSCRRRHDFDQVVMVPDGISYYGPSIEIQGVTRDCTDLGFGRYREWWED